MISSRRAAWIGLAVAICCLSPLSAQVRVWEGTMSIPVYAEGDPDPNPPLDQFGGPINYPYTMRQSLTNHRAEQNLRAVFLENEYLKCTVLPDLGGHLYTCVDKLSGQSMFYANPSIKKARISYRGAWSAFGDEFNFPVSHNWVSLSPVNYAFASHDDGSASITVGNVDRVYGMEWTVEMVLTPGSTVLRENVTLSNRTDAQHRFYWWNNAGIQVWEDSRICYPTHFTAAHGFADVDTWPINQQGEDLSVLRNQQSGPVSRFVHASREPFIGVWHPHTNAGIVHYSEYDELPGKKFWSWGDDAAGREWRHILSDNDSAYVEVQAGPFRNQETYGFMAPHTSMHFSEYWIPVRDLGGIARANLAGAINLERTSGTLTVSANVNHRVKGASLRLMQGEAKVWEAHEDLSPEHVWKKSVSISPNATPYRFEVAGPDGAILIAQTEGVYDTTPASQVEVGKKTPPSFPEESHRTVDDWLWKGQKEEEYGDLLGALARYRMALARFPHALSLLKANGRLLVTMRRYNEAIGPLQAVRVVDTTDPETAYYLGLSYAGTGDLRRAREMFEIATRLHGVQAAAFLQLAELSAQEHDLIAARRYLAKAQELSPRDERIAEEFAAVSISIKSEDANASLKKASEMFPASFFLKEVAGKPDVAHLAGDPYRVLQVATEFMQLGMYERALQVLSRTYPNVPAIQMEPGTPLPQEHPMVLYYRAYCQKKIAQNTDATLVSAAHASTRYVFPRGPLDYEVLTSAVQAAPNDANAHWLLGMEEFSRGLEDAGMQEWNKAATLNPHLPALFAARGKTQLLLKKDATAAMAEFEKGRQSDTSNPDVYVGLDQAMSLLKRPPHQIAQELKSFPDAKAIPQGMVYEIALASTEAGEFQQAESVFHDRFFSSGEGDTNVRQIWVEYRLQHALHLAATGQCPASMTELKELGSPVAGLSFTNEILPAMTGGARIAYLSGEIARQCGHEQEAAASYAAAAKSTSPDGMYWAMKASKKLHRYTPSTWKESMQKAHAEAEALSSTTSDFGYWMYVMALLEREMGEKVAAERHMEDALRSPDRRLSYHLVRLARSEQDSTSTGTPNTRVAPSEKSRGL